MLQDMELWTDVRRALFIEKISKRAASLRFGLSYYLIDKNHVAGDLQIQSIEDFLGILIGLDYVFQHTQILH